MNSNIRLIPFIRTYSLTVTFKVNSQNATIFLKNLTLLSFEKRHSPTEVSYLCNYGFVFTHWNISRNANLSETQVGRIRIRNEQLAELHLYDI